MPGIGSPDTANITIGKGFVLVKPDGATDYYHVGNAPSFQITPKAETLEHFSAMEGTKENDLTVVLSKGADVKLSMEEITARNLAMLMLGDVDVSDPTSPKVNLLTKSIFGCALQYYAMNDVGPRWKADLPRIEFVPSGTWDPIGDKFETLDVTGSLKSVSGNFGTLSYMPSVQTVAPTNILLPYIAGQLSPGSDPLDVAVGETLTAVIGAWTGYASIAYQWKAGGSPISGETGKTLAVSAGQSGSTITVDVIATNAIGTTTVTTAATSAVA